MFEELSNQDRLARNQPQRRLNNPPPLPPCPAYSARLTDSSCLLTSTSLSLLASCDISCAPFSSCSRLYYSCLSLSSCSLRCAPSSSFLKSIFVSKPPSTTKSFSSTRSLNKPSKPTIPHGLHGGHSPIHGPLHPPLFLVFLTTVPDPISSSSSSSSSSLPLATNVEKSPSYSSSSFLSNLLLYDLALSIPPLSLSIPAQCKVSPLLFLSLASLAQK